MSVLQLMASVMNGITNNMSSLNRSDTELIDHIRQSLTKISGEGRNWVWDKEEDKFGDCGRIYVEDTVDETGALVAFIHSHGNFRTFQNHKQAYSHADAQFISDAPQTIRSLLEIIDRLQQRQS